MLGKTLGGKDFINRSLIGRNANIRLEGYGNVNINYSDGYIDALNAMYPLEGGLGQEGISDKIKDAISQEELNPSDYLLNEDLRKADLDVRLVLDGILYKSVKAGKWQPIVIRKDEHITDAYMDKYLNQVAMSGISKAGKRGQVIIYRPDDSNDIFAIPTQKFVEQL